MLEKIIAWIIRINMKPEICINETVDDFYTQRVNNSILALHPPLKYGRPLPRKITIKKEDFKDFDIKINI